MEIKPRLFYRVVKILGRLRPLSLQVLQLWSGLLNVNALLPKAYKWYDERIGHEHASVQSNIVRCSLSRANNQEANDQDIHYQAQVAGYQVSTNQMAWLSDNATKCLVT